jgi:hypothetical protein
LTISPVTHCLVARNAGFHLKKSIKTVTGIKEIPAASTFLILFDEIGTGMYSTGTVPGKDMLVTLYC